ncbi:short-chain dehydrogenase [Fusarium albosuccineum]|uniref:Short-chain dehydrogenase n=1 Tax=Fusarium albosuccineum TaxID=1237068 RepID=A0A8H4KXX6_9HYPO|nr:short-chain dehydrogenase [Fusarium albosuccineum]
MSLAHDIVKATHVASYAAISPSRPELSQAGKTVLITGAATGIGLAISKAFTEANAATIVMIGRRPDILDAAVSEIRGLLKSPTAKVIGHPCDVADGASVAKLWDHLDQSGVVVDVLVLNAGVSGPAGPLVEAEGIWDAFEINAKGILNLVQRFWKQPNRNPEKALSLVNISTMVIHYFDVLGHMPTYSLTKNAGTLLVQLMAKDTPVDKMQCVSFHPGKINTASAQSAGIPAELCTEDANLPGSFAVWAASPEAAFLHGRFVWAEWDVGELKQGELRKKIDENPNFLKLGLHGF